MSKDTMDIILQGPMYEYTPAIAREYLKLSFVNNVIISCWDTCPTYDVDENVIVVRSSDAPTPGFGNRNRQIKSSRNGFEHVLTEFSAKLRTDQFISESSMHKLYTYYFANCEIARTDERTMPYNKIAVHGMCRDFAFHPIDHIFWGNTQDLIKFFDIEYESKSGVPDFNTFVRSETYITLPYVLSYYNEFSYISDNEMDYLMDNSPKRDEALAISERIMPSLFYVFPKIELSWPKYGMQLYHYDVMESERGGHAYWSEN